MVLFWRILKRLLKFRRRKPLSKEDGNANLDFDQVKPIFLTDQTERKERLKSIYLPLVEVDIGLSKDVSEAFEEKITQLIEDITTSKDVNDDKSAKALRELFTLSEQTSAQGFEPKTKMVRVANFKLVPALFKLVEHCIEEEDRRKIKAAEHLVLLVINSISIPLENKRLIAIDYSGVSILCKLLLKDPKCHMAAIILTNLTFASSKLRKDLVRAETILKIPLIPTLAYVLRACASSKSEYATIMSSTKPVQESLRELVKNDRNQCTAMIPFETATERPVSTESIRWCLCVLQNLLRPSKESHMAAHSLIRCGIVPFIFRFIMIQNKDSDDAKEEPIADPNTSISSSSGSSASLLSSEPLQEPLRSRKLLINPPSRWKSQLPQDAALFIVMNLSTVPSTIDYILHDTEAVDIIVPIIDFYTKFENEKKTMILTDQDDKRVARFQSLKARMTLAYLIGSSGHFGQRKRARTAGFTCKPEASRLHNALVIDEDSEALCFIELLSNTLHQQSKDGPGGYLSIMFNLEYVLLALRCLLTQYKNQTMFGTCSTCTQLNVLLLKIIALYSLNSKFTVINADTAEYACFSMYLLSNSGFRNPFLPKFYGNTRDIADSIAARVLYAYKELTNISAPSRHAVTQLLLRLNYMLFCDITNEVTTELRFPITFFDTDLLTAIQQITVVGEVYHGVEPRFDIFDRPIYGLWIPPPVQVDITGGSWDSHPTASAGGRTYENALHAVQDLSFGSTKYRHGTGKIDDIEIANTIAMCAEAIDNVENTESYNHTWRWYDTDDIILFTEQIRRTTGTEGNFNMSSQFWGFNYRNLFTKFCGHDTTL